MAIRKPQVQLISLPGALGRDIHQFVREITYSQVVETDLSQDIVAKPRQEIERQRRDLQEAGDGMIPAGAEVVDGEAGFRTLQQRLNTLPLIVADVEGGGIRCLDREIGVEVGIDRSIVPLGRSEEHTSELQSQ